MDETSAIIAGRISALCLLFIAYVSWSCFKSKDDDDDDDYPVFRVQVPENNPATRSGREDLYSSLNDQLKMCAAGESNDGTKRFVMRNKKWFYVIRDSTLRQMDESGILNQPPYEFQCLKDHCKRSILFSQDVENCRKFRQVVTPNLHISNMSRFENDIRHYTDDMLRNMQHHIFTDIKVEIDIEYYIKRCVFNILLKILYGVDTTELHHNKSIFEAVNTVNELMPAIHSGGIGVMFDRIPWRNALRKLRLFTHANCLQKIKLMKEAISVRRDLFSKEYNYMESHSMALVDFLIYKNLRKLFNNGTYDGKRNMYYKTLMEIVDRARTTGKMVSDENLSSNRPTHLDIASKTDPTPEGSPPHPVQKVKEGSSWGARSDGTSDQTSSSENQPVCRTEIEADIHIKDPLRFGRSDSYSMATATSSSMLDDSSGTPYHALIRHPSPAITLFAPISDVPPALDSTKGDLELQSFDFIDEGAQPCSSGEMPKKPHGSPLGASATGVHFSDVDWVSTGTKPKKPIASPSGASATGVYISDEDWSSTGAFPKKPIASPSDASATGVYISDEDWSSTGAFPKKPAGSPSGASATVVHFSDEDWIGTGAIPKKPNRFATSTSKKATDKNDAQPGTSGYVPKRLARDESGIEELSWRSKDYGAAKPEDNSDSIDVTLDKEKIIDEALAFLLTGHMSTSMAVYWTIFIVAGDRNLYQLVRRNLWEKGEWPTYTIDYINRMEHVLGAINEAMRLYPPIPYLSRKLARDSDIRGKGVREGVIVAAALPAIHSCIAKYPQNVKCFEENRQNHLINENIRQRQIESLRTFSIGERDCPGKDLATAIVKIMTAYILHTFDIDIVRESELGNVYSGDIFTVPSKSKKEKILSNVPGPAYHPLFGTTSLLLSSRKDRFPTLLKLANAFPDSPIVRVWWGSDPRIFITKASAAEEVLSNNKILDKGARYDALIPWLGKGLLISGGAKWKSRRRLLTPAFHFGILEKFFLTMNEHAILFVDKLNKLSDEKATFDFYPLSTNCTLGVICETAMGVRLSSSENRKYINAVCALAEIIVYRNQRPWLIPDFVFKLTKMGDNYKKHLKVVHDFTTKVIQMRKKEYVENKKNKGDIEKDGEFGIKRRIALLDLLIEKNVETGEIDDEGIQEEVDTFMFEGHDTTASALSWVIYNIGRFPEIQRKIQLELDAVLGKLPVDSFSISQLNELKYLECVIKESMRLFPPVPFYSRQTKEDTSIAGYPIPAGCGLVMICSQIHVDPDYYIDPSAFNPDRFLSMNSSGRHPFSFVPFSAGPRNCIGQRFAMTELKTVTAHVLHHFIVNSVYDGPDDLQAYAELILRPVKGHWISLKKR
ncbi:hypothetical protein CHUAL_009816 [Chamberlinius hualienensis]